jgi:hypothetical protein
MKTNILLRSGIPLILCSLFLLELTTPAATIVTTTLPSAGSTNSIALDRFSITASLDLLATSATNAANYSFREAGANGILGDGDDAI